MCSNQRSFISRQYTDLSKVDGFDNVFVCQCEDLVSTYCIPHLSEKHRAHIFIENDSCSCRIIVYFSCNVFESRVSFSPVI